MALYLPLGTTRGLLIGGRKVQSAPAWRYDAILFSKGSRTFIVVALIFTFIAELSCDKDNIEELSRVESIMARAVSAGQVRSHFGKVPSFLHQEKQGIHNQRLPNQHQFPQLGIENLLLRTGIRGTFAQSIYHDAIMVLDEAIKHNITSNTID